MSLRIVFFGSPQFAVPSLKALAADERCSVDLVITQPDRRAGRGRGLVAPPVKVAAQSLGVPVWQPDTLRSEVAHERLRFTQSDLFVVVAYGELFQRSVLALPEHGCLNVHPSLLPRYRGSAPIQSAILNGDAETGVSVIQMVRRLDAGPIVAQQRIALQGTETGGSLSETLSNLAGAMLPGVVIAWAAGQIEAQMQDDSQATITRELRKSDGEINWALDAGSIERLVRAFQPWPTAWTTLAGKRIVIERVARDHRALDQKPGSVVSQRRDVLVACGDGSLRLIEVRPEGKRVTPADAWFRGLHADDHPRFEAHETSADH